jgi:uncharacterized membrane protein (DUF2068 family)
MRTKEHDRFLQLIAVFKFLKAILFILAALGAFGLMQQGIGNQAREWGAALAFGSGQRIVRHVVMQILSLSRSKIAALGVVALFYAALFMTEGIGLWRERRWAEYLTVIATGSLIPLEIYEVAHHVTLLRVAMFVVNVAVVIYLIARLRAPRRESGSGRVATVPRAATAEQSTAG